MRTTTTPLLACLLATTGLLACGDTRSDAGPRTSIDGGVASVDGGTSVDSGHSPADAMPRTDGDPGTGDPPALDVQRLTPDGWEAIELATAGHHAVVVEREPSDLVDPGQRLVHITTGVPTPARSVIPTGRLPYRPSVAIGASGSVHVAFVDKRPDEPPAHLNYARGSSGDWSLEDDIAPVQYASGFTTVGTIGDTAIAVDGTGRVWLGYYFGAENELRVAQRSSGGWTFETVATEADFETIGDVGARNWLALSPSGEPHVLFAQGLADGRLFHATRGGASWNRELVTDDGIAQAPLFDATGRLHFAHVGFDSDQVSVWSRGSEGWTNIYDAVTEAANAALATDAEGRLHLLYVTNGADRELVWLRRDAGAWEASTAPFVLPRWGSGTFTTIEDLSFHVDDEGRGHASFIDDSVAYHVEITPR